MDADAVEQWWPMVQRIATKVARGTRGYWTPEELASFGYEGLLDALAKYNPDKGPWLAYAKLRIRGAILDQMSVHRWHFLAVDREAVLDRLPAPDQPDQVADREAVRAILDDVGPLTRQVLVLYYLCGYDQAKIGDLLGVTPSAVCHRIQRGLRYLRALHA